MKLSFRKRIATYFIISTAIIIALVFGVVYYIVQKTVYYNLDKDVTIEAEDHRSKVELDGKGMLFFINKKHLLASEHSQAQVNPVFIQLIDNEGKNIDKSPNLKRNVLLLKRGQEPGVHYNTSLNGHPIRQVQIRVQVHGKHKGFIIAAMSLESSLMVLKNLRYTLFFIYPISLIGLFFISSFLTGRSIQPVISIIETADEITSKNLHQRVEVPPTNDELKTLSLSINALLQRIENALAREQQFTSDASHELRTPISVLRGTLEVLLRKPRSAEEYAEKISYCLNEVDRMALILDQLLEVARHDEGTEFFSTEKRSASEIIQEIMQRRSQEAMEKHVLIDFTNQCSERNLDINAFFGATIIENILVNAIKYSYEHTTISIDLSTSQEHLICRIKDEGVGIKPEDLDNIFQPFFRSEALNHKHIDGSGLGLAIVQKAAKAIGAKVSVTSEYGKGTTFEVYFKKF